MGTFHGLVTAIWSSPRRRGVGGETQPGLSVSVRNRMAGVPSSTSATPRTPWRRPDSRPHTYMANGGMKPAGFFARLAWPAYASCKQLCYRRATARENYELGLKSAAGLRRC